MVMLKDELTLRRYKNVVGWHMALKDTNTAKMWVKKMLHVVRTCIGEDSRMYRELQ